MSPPATVQTLPWHRREDTWASLIALALVAGATAAFFANRVALVAVPAVNVPGWSGSAAAVLRGLGTNPAGLLALFGGSLLLFAVAAAVIGWRVRDYVVGFTALYLFSIVVAVLGSNQLLKQWQLETPLLALALGLLVGNAFTLPRWFQAALRTEFYVKVGIVLMGATLPFTLILQAGPLAILQATIVSVVTFTAIYVAATRLFGLDPRFGATLGAGGSICGVSASIAVGGACRADKGHVSVAISLVVVWAVAMIFVLPAWARHLGLAPGVAGAWIGTSEFADAAGFAAAATIGDERAVKTFTLMKVVGRDMFVGVWALVVAVLAVTRWERRDGAKGERVGAGEVWRRFPKFLVGFFAASLVVTLVLALVDQRTGARFTKDALGPLKTLRGWAFAWTFLSIGFTTRFRDLASFGWRPLAAFALGVAVNVPLGWWLSTQVFASHWAAVR